jgi:hypothetical protein
MQVRGAFAEKKVSCLIPRAALKALFDRTLGEAKVAFQ